MSKFSNVRVSVVARQACFACSSFALVLLIVAIALICFGYGGRKDFFVMALNITIGVSALTVSLLHLMQIQTGVWKLHWKSAKEMWIAIGVHTACMLGIYFGLRRVSLYEISSVAILISSLVALAVLKVVTFLVDWTVDKFEACEIYANGLLSYAETALMDGLRERTRIGWHVRNIRSFLANAEEYARPIVGPAVISVHFLREQHVLSAVENEKASDALRIVVRRVVVYADSMRQAGLHIRPVSPTALAALDSVVAA